MSSNRKKTIFAFYITLLSVLVLAVAAYAWMSLSSSPVVSDLSLSLISENALEIAPDVDGTPGEWGSILDLTDLSKNAAKLKPVTFSAEEFAFRIGQYNLAGQFAGTVRLTDQTNDSDHDASVAADTEALLETVFAYSFYLRTDTTDCMVSLSGPLPVDEDHPDGLGTFLLGDTVLNEETQMFEDAGNGAEYAMRIGFLIHANKHVRKDDEDIFVIYEPNCDGGKGTETYGVGGGLLQGDFKLIRQKKSSVSIPLDPYAEDSEVEYSIGTFDGDSELFQLRGGEERRITMFIWLEGQDDDCTNAISKGKIFANLQFTAQPNSGDSPILSE